MAYFIAASPLVKIYLPEWHDRLLEEPDLIHDYKTPFSFVVDTGSTGIRVNFNTPQQVHGGDDKQNRSVHHWLTGGPDGHLARDSDIYGIVEFNPQMDLVETMDQFSQMDQILAMGELTKKEAAEEAAKLHEQRKFAAAKLHAARERVKKLSEERIRRAIRFNHNNLIKQWQTNEEMKMGKYPPSITEMLGAGAIEGEIAKSDAKNRKARDRFNELMSHTQA